MTVYIPEWILWVVTIGAFYVAWRHRHAYIQEWKDAIFLNRFCREIERTREREEYERRVGRKA